MDFYFSKKAGFFGIIAGFIFTTIGLMMIIFISKMGTFFFISGLFLMLLGLFFVVTFTRNLFFIGPIFTISKQGFEHHRLKTGLIPWEEIKELSIKEHISQGVPTRYMVFNLNEPETYLKNASKTARKINQKTGFGDLCIAFTGLNPGLDEAFDYIYNTLKPDIVFEK